MDITTFSQLGIGSAAIIIVYIVVKYFIKAIQKKDGFIIELIEKFNERTAAFNKTMDNHIDHETKQRKEETIAFKELTNMIKAFIDKR